MPDILITEFMDEDVLRRVFADRDYVYDPAWLDKGAERLHALRDARALIVRNRTQVRADVIAAAPKLRVVGRLGVGLDNIDVEACRERGILVRPALRANDVAVAEYVITATLLLLRRSSGSTDAVVAGDWPRMQCIGREAAGRQLGLIGFGSIARETAVRARGLGMTVAAYDPHLAERDPAWTGARRMDLEPLLRHSDVVSLHVPLTTQTRHIMDAGRIAMLKPGAILINAARGGVVDEPALIAALKSGQLGAAALDVFETEPMTASSGAAFADVPNLWLTPHIAGVTEESNVRVSEIVAAMVLRDLDA